MTRDSARTAVIEQDPLGRGQVDAVGRHGRSAGRPEHAADRARAAAGAAGEGPRS